VRKIAIFGWPVAGVCLALLEALIRMAIGAPTSAAAVVWMSIGWLEWALLAPIVVILARRFPYRPRARRRFVLAHAIAAPLISTMHSALFFALRIAILGMPGPPGWTLRQVWIADLPIHLALDLFVYGGTLIATQVALLLQASRRRDEERLALEHALAGAELDAYKLQLPVEAVTGKLREIEQAIAVDVVEAEELIERFSAGLRQSLEVVSIHAAVEEIAQDEEELEAELPQSLPLPWLALLLFALVPVIQMFFDVLLIVTAVARDRPIRWMLVAEHVSRAATSFPVTVAMVWLGARVQRVALVAAGAAVLPLAWVVALEAALFGGEAARELVAGSSRTLDFLVFFAVGVGALAYARYRAWRAKAVEIAELESRLLRTRAAILRLQLNPHFLFNALNSVAALLEDDAAGAAAMLAQLRQFVGRVLENSDRDAVPLREELELLTAYIAIENVRFDGRVQLDVRADAQARGALVPSFLLQPLVENALRHGLEPERGGRVYVRAAVDDGALHIEVDDNGRPGDPAHPPRQGLGLSNTRARLAQLYGDDFFLDTAARTDGFGVAVGLPYRAAPST
jgi:two-component system, LytTR family, sensor kinase